ITQFIAQQADKYFSNIDAYEIHIKDGNQARALITKGKDDKKQNVHIYKR
ncbi:MAG: CamS family sex pheromone protein, partial [Staphylococcus simulans]|nr:CamS family sex pheromone protein [Staphylococcus simulans]